MIHVELYLTKPEVPKVRTARTETVDGLGIFYSWRYRLKPKPKECCGDSGIQWSMSSAKASRSTILILLVLFTTHPLTNSKMPLSLTSHDLELVKYGDSDGQRNTDLAGTVLPNMCDLIEYSNAPTRIVYRQNNRIIGNNKQLVS